MDTRFPLTAKSEMMRTLSLLIFLTMLFGSVAALAAPAKTTHDAYLLGMKLYRSFQFSQTVVVLQKALKATGTKLSKVRRVNIYLLMAMSYYNLAKLSSAKKWFIKALKLNPKARIPKPQTQQTLNHFAAIREAWRERSGKVARRPPVVRRTMRRVVVRRSVVRTPATRVPVLPPRPRSAPTRGFWQRHTTSVILLGSGLLVGAASVGVGVLFAQQKETLLKHFKDRSNFDGTQLQSEHTRASTTGLVTTSLLIASGSFGVAAIIAFIAESASSATPATKTKSITAAQSRRSFGLGHSLVHSCHCESFDDVAISL